MGQVSVRANVMESNVFQRVEIAEELDAITVVTMMMRMMKTKMTIFSRTMRIFLRLFHI